MLCFLVFRIPDDGQSPETRWFWQAIFLADQSGPAVWYSPCTKALSLEGMLGSGYIDLYYLVFGTIWRWAVSFMSRPLYIWGKCALYPLHSRFVGPHSRSRRHEKKILDPVGTRYPTLGRPARNQSLYWLSYPVCIFFFVTYLRQKVAEWLRTVNWKRDRMKYWIM
jgi:hypothetical protein